MQVRWYKEDKTYCSCNVEKTNYYCTECGKQEVYEEIGDGDFYQGNMLYCKNCNNSFTMPSRGIDNKITWENEK